MKKEVLHTFYSIKFLQYFDSLKKKKIWFAKPLDVWFDVKNEGLFQIQCYKIHKNQLSKAEKHDTTQILKANITIHYILSNLNRILIEKKLS